MYVGVIVVITGLQQRDTTYGTSNNWKICEYKQKAGWRYVSESKHKLARNFCFIMVLDS